MNFNLRMTVERSKRRSNVLSLVFITKSCLNYLISLQVIVFKSKVSRKLFDNGTGFPSVSGGEGQDFSAISSILS